MACVVIKLIPRNYCNCAQQAAPAEMSTQTTSAQVAQPSGAVVPFQAAASMPAATTDPGTTTTDDAEKKAGNWWKWALGLGLGALLIFGDGKEKNGETNTKRKKK